MPNGNWKECPIRGTLKIYSEIKILGFADNERITKEERTKNAGWQLNKVRIRKGCV